MKWQESFKKRLSSISQINEFFNLSLPEIPFDISIPLHLAYKIREAGLDGILAAQFIPSKKELEKSGSSDPIGDKVHQKKGQLIHRYHNRVLFLPTTVCPIICRYCFRKNSLSNQDELYASDFESTLKYLNDHQEIEEIIFSGGDPLMLSNEKIKYFLESFSKIPHIKYIRFHTRTPISLPKRIDDELIKTFKYFSGQFTSLNIAVHVNHLDEFDNDNEHALFQLGAIPNLTLLSQTVLLKNINDDAETLCRLYRKCATLGIRPYYLHHPDEVTGGMYFQVDIKRGRIIYATLRNLLPGWLIPNYVLDIPGGHGKTPIYNPESLEFSGKIMDLNQSPVTISKNHRL